MNKAVVFVLVAIVAIVVMMLLYGTNRQDGFEDAKKRQRPFTTPSPLEEEEENTGGLYESPVSPAVPVVPFKPSQSSPLSWWKALWLKLMLMLRRKAPPTTPVYYTPSKHRWPELVGKPLPYAMQYLSRVAPGKTLLPSYGAWATQFPNPNNLRIPVDRNQKTVVATPFLEKQI